MVSTVQPIIFTMWVASETIFQDFGWGVKANLSSGQRDRTLRVPAIS